MEKRILCVDDEEDILDCIQFLFEEEGYCVRAELSPEYIFSIISEFNPNLVLLDVNLCKFNGLDICKDLSLNAYTRAIPVIMVSSDARIYRAKEYGAVDFVLKPFNIDDLVGKVNEYLSAKIIPISS